MLPSASAPVLSRSSSRRTARKEQEEKLLEAPRYAAEVNSIARPTREALLLRPSTPLIVREVFLRRRNFVEHDLHVLLVSDSAEERYQVKESLLDLGYLVSSAPSGAQAKQLLLEQASDFHIVLVDARLKDGTQGPGVSQLIFWARGIPTFSEVAFIVMAATTIDINTSTLLLKLGATDILPKPIEKETLFKLRKVVGNAQSLEQQRMSRKATGGTRLVTAMLGKREWRKREKQMAEKKQEGDEEEVEEVRSSHMQSLMEKKGGGGAEVDVRTAHGTLPVLLIHRTLSVPETESRDAVCSALKESGYHVVIARDQKEALKNLGSHTIEWALVLLDFKFDYPSALFILREMATRQILLPVIALHEDRALDTVARIMRAGVVDILMAPVTRTRCKGLTKYLLSVRPPRVASQIRRSRQSLLVPLEPAGSRQIPLVSPWIPLVSPWIPPDPAGATWIHLDPPGSTWIPLDPIAHR
jgi:CheY-like chemotaxis protein